MRKSMTKLQALALGSLLAINGYAQNGDKEGEAQPMLFPEHLIPDAPVLSPEEALKSFTVKPGFRIEIAASFRFEGCFQAWYYSFL